MKTRRRTNGFPKLTLLGCCLLGASLTAVAQTAPPSGVAAVWTRLEQPALDAARVAKVESTVLEKDAATLTFLSGTLALAQPVAPAEGQEGRVLAAAFKGRGRLRFAPSLPMERQQLAFHSGQQPLEAEFSEAVLLFTDETAAELSGQLAFGSGQVSGLQKLYLNRNKRWKKYGLNWEPRLLKSLLSPSPERYALFVAELKTDRHGWLTLIVDAADPEQVELVRFDSRRRARDIWSKFPAGGRPPQLAFEDPLGHHDYRISSYVLDVTIENNTELHGTATVELDFRRGGERVLLFQLDPNLRVTEITGAEGQPLSFFQPKDPKDDFFLGDYLVVVSPDAIPEGRTQLHFAYHGKRVVRKVGSGNFFCRSFGWYPTYGSGRYTITTNQTAGKSDFEIILRVPKKYTAVAVGSKKDDRKEGDYRITRWTSDIPLKVAGFAYGDYRVVTEQSGETAIEIYANKRPDDFLQSVEMVTGAGSGVAMGSLSPSNMAKEMAVEIGNSLRVMEAYFGPYPYKKLAVSNIPYSYGQGWPSLLYLSALSFLDTTQRHNLGITDHVQLTDFFRAHETSHQWWGHVVGWKSYHDQWLSEGFAEFSGNLYTLFRRKPGEYFRLLRNSRRNLRQKDREGAVYDRIGPIYAGRRLRSAKHPGGYSRVVYEKGGWVLHMIRMMLYDPRNSDDKDARFKALMKDFTSTHFNQAASTEDFKAILEKHMTRQMDLDRNGTMDWFFNSWVYGTGIPHYEFSYTVEPAPQEGKFVLKGLLRQKNVPAGFRMIVPLYVHQGKRKLRLGWLTGQAQETTFNVTIGFKPTKVTLNEWEDVLATVDYKN